MIRVSTIAIVLVMSLLLASCGSRGTISTKDDSVEYQTARKLPPLKKPSTVLVPESSATTAQSVAVENRSGASDFVVVESVDTATPITDSSIDSLPADSVSTDSISTDSVSTSSFSGISAEITNLKNNTARLKVATDFDTAWEYLTTKLGRSSVTVFSRNKAARRFSIGCAAFQVPESEDSESGGWAIFNRNRVVSDEYCALSVSESRGNTVVTARDREGDEVGKVGATLVFEQLLNN